MLETSGLADGVPVGVAPRAPRKNVMLSATISSGTVSAPVRIRNLSELGAMVDGPALPQTGATLMLNRLALSVAATVIWSHGGRCGLRLRGPIVVEDWISGASTTAGLANAGQFRVDQLQSAIRSGAALPRDTQAPAPAPADVPPVEQRIAAELARVTRILDAIGETLADDVDVLVRHERAIQNLDIAAKVIEQLSGVMAADDREKAAGSVEMHDLRSRLSGRLTLT